MAAYPPRFGPPYWKIIHLTGRRLDAIFQEEWKELVENKSNKDIILSKKRETLWNFLNDLDDMLPCDACSRHFLWFRNEHPLPSRQITAEHQPIRDSFWKWTVDLHNHTNNITGKRVISYEEAEEMFQKEWLSMDENAVLSHAQRVRMEDHAKIQSLQESLRKYEQGVLNSPVNISLLIATILLSIIVFVILFVSWVK
jgi:hypothetical protein